MKKSPNFVHSIDVESCDGIYWWNLYMLYIVQSKFPTKENQDLVRKCQVKTAKRYFKNPLFISLFSVIFDLFLQFLLRR